MRSQRKRGNRPRGRSPTEILSYFYPLGPEPRGATQRKKSHLLSSPEQARPTGPPAPLATSDFDDSITPIFGKSREFGKSRNSSRKRPLLMVHGAILTIGYGTGRNLDHLRPRRPPPPFFPTSSLACRSAGTRGGSAKPPACGLPTVARGSAACAARGMNPRATLVR